MGYVPKKKTFLLKFTDPDMDGLSVTVDSLALGMLLEFEEYAQRPGLDGFAEMIDVLAASTRSWNIEREDGTPVAPDTAGYLEQEPAFVTQIIQAWQRAMNGVPAPLAEGSSSGATTPDVPIPMIPMDPPLQSLAS